MARKTYLQNSENFIGKISTRTKLAMVSWVLACLFFCLAENVQAQGFHEELAPISLPSAPPTLPSLYPTDVTPVNINRERELLKPGFTYYVFQKLPSHFWFNVTAETSQRFESNVFFTTSHPRRDYVFRTLPNVSMGYEVYKKINIYCNYFTIKDVFVGHRQLTFPTTQSLSWGLRRDFTISPRTNLQLDWQAREIWQSPGLRQFDFLPGMTLTRFVTPNIVAYINTILQLRGGQYFEAPTREIDPFYTAGLLYSRHSWMFSAVGTLVTNYRHPPFNDAIPPVSNNSIIADLEISHPVPKLPFLTTFIRAEPIWNWKSHNYPGISGFDFRLFSGIRLTIAKPTYQSSIETLKQQLKELNVGPPSNAPAGAPEQTPSLQPAPGPAEENPTESPNELPATTPGAAPSQLPPAENPSPGKSPAPTPAPAESPQQWSPPTSPLGPVGHLYNKDIPVFKELGSASAPSPDPDSAQDIPPLRELKLASTPNPDMESAWTDWQYAERWTELQSAP